jgi:hypothetical protein
LVLLHVNPKLLHEANRELHVRRTDELVDNLHHHFTTYTTANCCCRFTANRQLPFLPFLIPTPFSRPCIVLLMLVH